MPKMLKASVLIVGAIAIASCSAPVNTSLKPVRGQWSTELELKERFEDCGYESYTDSNGKTQSRYDCDTETREIDEVELSGVCVLDGGVCEPVAWPDVPAHWSLAGDQFLERESEFRVEFEDVEGDRSKPIGFSYSEAEYIVLTNEYLGELMPSSKGIFGYKKPQP